MAEEKTQFDDTENARDIIISFKKAMIAQYEEEIPVQSYANEVAVYKCVQNGDVERLKEYLAHPGNSATGKLSDNPLKQAQYLIVSGIALVTRYAMTGGMPEAEAYNLSDTYIQKLADITDAAEVYRLFSTAIMDFTMRVHNTKIYGKNSWYITKVKRYISEHLDKRITLTEAAELCGITPQYLSALFKKETGCTLSWYIRNQKLQLAAIMLEQSSFSVNRIATILEFPSQSAFSSQFRERFGATPLEYRNRG